MCAKSIVSQAPPDMPGGDRTAAAVRFLTHRTNRGKSSHPRRRECSLSLLIAYPRKGYDPIRMKALRHLLLCVFCITIGVSSAPCASVLFLSTAADAEPGTSQLFTSALFSLTGNVLTVQFTNPSADLTSSANPVLAMPGTASGMSIPEFEDQGVDVGICVRSCSNMAGGWNYTLSGGGMVQPLGTAAFSASSVLGDATAPNISTYTVVLPGNSSVLFIAPAMWISAPDMAAADAPEPGTWGLAAIALAALAARRFRRPA